MSFPHKIDKDSINRLPQMEFTGKIVLVQDQHHAAEVAALLSQETLLGFDTETRPSFHADQQHKVSLLQLATSECAYLIRLNKISLPLELAALLSDEKIMKVGIGLRDDVKALQKLRSFEPAGFVDLAYEAKLRGYKELGLRTMTAIFLGQRLSKAAKLTNWDNRELTPPQMHYAALDAAVALKLYQVVMKLPTLRGP